MLSPTPFRYPCRDALLNTTCGERWVNAPAVDAETTSATAARPSITHDDAIGLSNFIPTS